MQKFDNFSNGDNNSFQHDWTSYGQNTTTIMPNASIVNYGFHQGSINITQNQGAGAYGLISQKPSSITACSWYYHASCPGANTNIFDYGGNLSAQGGIQLGLFGTCATIGGYYKTGSGIQGYAGSAYTFTPGNWYFLCMTYNSSTGNNTVYVNGIKTSSDIQGSGALVYTSPDSYQGVGGWVSQFGTTQGMKGFIDDYIIWNRTLSSTEILTVYNSSIPSIEWNILNNTVFYNQQPNISANITFSDLSLTSNLTYTNLTSSKITILSNYGVETNTTYTYLIRINNTAYLFKDYSVMNIGNYNLTLTAIGGNALISTSTKTIYFSVNSLINSNINNSFVKQVPADINTLNVFSVNGGNANISYFIKPQDNSTSTVNISSIRLCYFENKTTGQVYYYINSTQTQSTSTCIIFTENDTISNIYSWSLSDNIIYIPGTYLLSSQIFSTTAHTANTLTSTNNLVKAILTNVTNETAYNILEYMANNTGSCVNPMLVYYCNSSYTTGLPSTSPYCANIYTQPCDTKYNHSHGASKYSSHILVPLGLSNGKLNGIIVTPTSQILLKGAAGSTWQWWSIPIETNPTAIQTSSNIGTSWSNNLGSTWDIHLHQYTGNESLWYMSWVKNQTGGDFNSTIKQEPINLGGLPPTQPSVYSPSGNVSLSTNINWTQSSSPNGYSIQNYTLKLYNSDLTLNKSIITTDGSTFNYTWDTTTTADGLYYVGIYACDTNNLCSTTGYSPGFTIDNIGPTITISSPTNISYYTLIVTLTASALDANLPISKIWYTVDGGSNIIYTSSVDINTLTAGGHVINVSSNDTLNNVNSKNVAFTTSPIPPALNGYILSPLNIFYSQVTYATITLAAGDNTIDKVWIQNAAGTVLNITTGSVGVNILPYYPNGVYGTYYVYAYANDTEGYSRSNATFYTLIIQPPLNVSNNPTTNNLITGNPLKAATQNFTNLLGGLFWAIIMGVLFVALWLRTNNFIYPTLVLFTLTFILGVNLPPIAQQISNIIYIAAIGLILWKIASPSYTQ